MTPDTSTAPARRTGDAPRTATGGAPCNRTGPALPRRDPDKALAFVERQGMLVMAVDRERDVGRADHAKALDAPSEELTPKALALPVRPNADRGDLGMGAEDPLLPLGRCRAEADEVAARAIDRHDHVGILEGGVRRPIGHGLVHVH